MASAKDLKKRIGSVKNTQQITRAMKLVSAAKLRRAQDAITQARPYAVSIKKFVSGIANDVEAQELSPLLKERPVKKVNVLLFTSDKGLCGGFNAQLNRMAEAMYKQDSGKYDEFTFTCVGRKGHEYLKLRGIPVRKNYTDFYKGFDYGHAVALAEELAEGFLNEEFDEVRLIFAEFKSALSQVVTKSTLLPMKIEAAQGEEGNFDDIIDFVCEPSQEAILTHLLPRYLNSQIFRAVLETSASEHGARMAAMDSASKNAGEVIRSLQLQYNKVRQAGITSELLEITAGAEAIK